MNFIIRAHPNTPVEDKDVKKYPRVSVSRSELAELLAAHDLFIASNVTSASLDAYCVGLPIIMLLNPGQLNLSPLKDQEGVMFVANVNELVRALTLGMTNHKGMEMETFFNLNSALPRWGQSLA